MIYIYAGYYEIYVTEKRLKKPRVLIYTAATPSEANAFLMDVDDHILLDINLINKIDFYSEIIKINGDKIEVVNESEC